MAKQRRRWRWVSRNSKSYDIGFVTVWQNETKPALRRGAVARGGPSGRFWYDLSEEDDVKVCFKQFTEMTGLRLKQGQILKVEFSAKVVGG